MQQCPKCGYRQVDWPVMLLGLAFLILYAEFIFGIGHDRLIGDVLPLFALLAAAGWRAFIDKRNRREYLKLHPSPAERVKSHIKPAV